VADELDGHLAQPHLFSAHRLERLAAALRGGFADFLRDSLRLAAATTPETQWRVIESVLREADEDLRLAKPRRPGLPRRIVEVAGVTIRRERRKDGWSLHFHGADEAVIEEIVEQVVAGWGRE
jgi:ParB family chromosome partitioning protein